MLFAVVVSGCSGYDHDNVHKGVDVYISDGGGCEDICLSEWVNYVASVSSSKANGGA